RDVSTYAVCDVTNADSIIESYIKACLEFGGVDIIVNCAGLARSSSLTDTSESEWYLMQDVLAKGQFLVSREGVKILQQQGMGGDIINIVSKNALVAGPNNVAYGSAKAAQAHMSRLMAAELAPYKIRVNSVNPDAVIANSKIWSDGWAKGRAEAYGITVEDLPAHYAKRTLLNEIILPEDIANAVYAFLAEMTKSTGNIVNVDGGIAAAFVR
ncbi:MAG: SDR family oxidoreductase, partial [Bacteroidetes bacterium]|nr:SDR family oxidoreductase [Bacteroidota bacterium]